MGRSSFVLFSFAFFLISFAANADLRTDLKRQVESDHHPISYGRAQMELLGNIALTRLNDGSYAIDEVYCSTPYGTPRLGNSVGPGKKPSSMIINVEHTAAQSWFKGRYYAGVAKADLHHLYPSDSRANSMRGHFAFGEVHRIKNVPKCFDDEGQSISTESKLGAGNDKGGELVFEPPTAHKGNVARALFYFSVRYDFPLKPSLEDTLRRWHKLDPVDQTKVERNNAIARIQGNRNPFIDHPEYADQIANF